MKKTPITIALAALLSIGMNTVTWAENPQTTQTSPATEKDMQTLEKNAQTQMKKMQPLSEATNAQPSATLAQESTPAPKTAAINPEDYEGKDLINAKGEKIGNVKKLVTHTTDQQTYAVVNTGGFMGFGDTGVVIAIDQLQPQNEQILLSSDLTEAELKTSMKYQEAEFSAFELQGELKQE